jgi:hypothetical protein
MEIRLGSTAGPKLASVSECIDCFAEQTRLRQGQWLQRLVETPDEFSVIESEIDRYYRLAAGRLTAALLAEATAQPGMQEQIQRVRQEAACPVASPRSRPLHVRLLCGIVLAITTAYCPPRGKASRASHEERTGLYPELAALGFAKGCSPALQYTVARTVALQPSIALARKELARQGIRLDTKTVRRIAERLGAQLLELRRRELFAWRAGDLPAGMDFAGRRVAVQIDGGRIRLRENKRNKGCKKKRRRVAFHTPWREPKVLTIFEIDQQGKMTRRHRQPLIDGTLLGPDHLAELLAYHLYQLGVHRAALAVFAADGAPWIWERLPWVVKRAGLIPSRVVYVLDFCHAAHHISLALQALGMAEGPQRSKTYRQLRKLLRRSRYDQVVEALERLARGQPKDSEAWREIRYLEKHGEAGHLQYATFRRRGIPCGSGAIESAVRRVVNLRLKSNAMYWLPENAEALFSIRATLLCDRWEETLQRLRCAMARDRRVNWAWQAPKTSKHPKAALGFHRSSMQATGRKQSPAAAA